MGSSDQIARISADVACVASCNFAVLIRGETGTGKELVARAIHQASPRASAPFVAVDCGAIPETLFESELFGHEKGAFTGAERQKAGKFEIASGGTLFLDEISNMPPGCQAKLLRALQDKSVTRVGGTKPVSVDIRLLAATNRDLETAVSAAFRRDLFFRLNEFTIAIPPLRERKEDIIFLAKRFLDLTNHELQKGVRGFSEPAVERLLRYDWPGNVRELRSAISRAVLLADQVIDEDHLRLQKAPQPPVAFGDLCRAERRASAQRAGAPDHRGP
jgi:two-component system nitrogen regulation response regulator GlnG